MGHRFASSLKLFCFLTTATCVAYAQPVLVNFDDLRPPYDGYGLAGPIPSGYAGFDWYGFWCLNTSYGIWNGTGYHNGLVSGANLAYTPAGSSGSISAPSFFDLRSAYLTAAFVDGLPVRVKGYSSLGLAHDNLYNLSVNSPTLINFDFLGVNRVEFSTAFGDIFVVDNVVLAVPEPNMLAILLLGAAASSIGRMMRKRSG